MSHIYSHPKRESDTYSLPDVETFTARYGDCPFCSSTVIEDGCGQFHCDECRDGRKDQGVIPEEITTGWFYHACFPGCLPDSEPIGPIGPFAMEIMAIEAAQQDADEYNDDES